MANVNDQERSKFVLDGTGNVCVSGTYALFDSETTSPLDDLEAGKFDGSSRIRLVSS